ncbi:hypothetical protein NDR87_31050 [Nocardia sp. CDC159]|uniref:DUF4232 domain-containing protein n=1 Tax=Nocardia pulmonis TaxID=2951408 RepID=A0A9X2ECU6_9NOCA|nr:MULTISPECIES: hypothetical protein [Nocardia]MCM6778011.1 hypothetical protein [Nocardia pulmonis]MCM6790818.1 hypothetical protein [Nocardia sp. CDC159]
MQTRSLRIAAATFIALACGIGLSACTPSTQSPSTSAAAPSTDRNIGDEIAFARADNGERIGIIKILDAAAVPARCALLAPPDSPILGLRMEIVNNGRLALSRPASGFALTVLSVKDSQGYTQQVTIRDVGPECEAQFPQIASPPAPGKSIGWVMAQLRQPNPSAVVYTASVLDGTSFDDLKPVAAAPAAASVKLPDLSMAPPISPTSAPTTASTTAPSEQQFPATAPAVGQRCDLATDRWAKDANGGRLRCATAGGVTPKWVSSVPFIGTRAQGSPCDPDAAAVAETRDGTTLVCVGDTGSATWTPGP